MIQSILAEAGQSVTVDPVWLSPAAIIFAVWFLWKRVGRVEAKLDEVNERLGKHDLADAKLKGQVKAVKKDVRRLEKKVDDGFAEIKELLEAA